MRQRAPTSRENVAYELDLFRRGRLSHFELSRTLGLDRFETEALLKKRMIFDGSLTATDLDDDRRTLNSLMSKGR